MKVAAHPLVVAVAMGLLGPGALETEESSAQARPCVDCGASGEDEHVARSSELTLPAAEHAVDPEVEGWLAMPEPTPEARARALADYLATTA
jgi:hypothetical protein